MTNFEPCIDGAGWLSMARTDPEWRRQGVALFLQGEIAKHAKRKDINPLRLWITSNNKPSILACEKGGFRRVCEAAHIHANLRGKKKTKTTPSSPSRPLIQSCMRSGYLTTMNGYIGRQWHFLKPTPELLTHLGSQGEFYNIDHSVLLMTEPEKRLRQPQSSLTILEGPLTQGLRAGKEIARGLNARVLSCYIPFDQYQIAAAKRLGFRRRPWGKHCIVFEKRLR